MMNVQWKTHTHTVSEAPPEPPALNNRPNFSDYVCLLLETAVNTHRHTLTHTDTSQGVLCPMPVQQFESAKVWGLVSVVSCDAQELLTELIPSAFWLCNEFSTRPDARRSVERDECPTPNPNSQRRFEATSGVFQPQLNHRLKKHS